MRRTSEEALSMASARHKLRVVLAGQAYLVCPYKPAALYHDGHWVPAPIKRWLECTEPECPYHYLPIIVKCHVPALVNHVCGRADDAPQVAYDPKLAFRGENWSMKILEITAGALKHFLQQSRPDQLAIIFRPGTQRNGPVHFKWLDTVLSGVPRALAEMNLEAMLPAIIHGKLKTHTVLDGLDKHPEIRTEHKINTTTVENRGKDGAA